MDKGVQFLAVNASLEPAAPSKAYKETHRLTFPVLIDETGHTPSNYGVDFIPQIAVIDRRGRLVAAQVEIDDLAQRLDGLLKEP